MSTVHIEPPFGRLITAMITPFKKDGEIDWGGVEKLAQHLADTGHDAITVNGTTGEAPTTKSSEKLEIIRVVKKVVGDRVNVHLLADHAGGGGEEDGHNLADVAADHVPE